MLNKFKFLLPLFLIAIFSVLSAMENFNFRAEAKKISNIVIKEMKRDYSLYCDGQGGGMPDNLRSIKVSFVAYRKGSIEEAREIEVKAIQRFIKLINEDEKLRPYLCEFPFPTRGIEVSLSFNQKNGSYYPDNALAFITHINGILYYESRSLAMDKFTPLHQESFEEALKIVQQNNNKIKDENHIKQS
jgi:hypothetical protein